MTNPEESSSQHSTRKEPVIFSKEIFGGTLHFAEEPAVLEAEEQI